MLPEEFRSGELMPEAEVRRCLGACGASVKVYRGCRIVPPERVQVGSHVQIDEDVFIFAGLGVKVGSYVHLAFGCSISGGGECLIGDFAGIAAGVRLITGSDLIDEGGLTNPTVPAEMRRVKRSKVEVGNHALIFTNSIVLPGVVIGEGAVIAAGSIVHRSVKPWTIHAGNPLVQVGVREPEPVLENARRLMES